MISILCPSRGRPAGAERMVTSALATAADPDQVQVVLYRDDDDPATYPDLPNTTVVTGPRIVLSQAWNGCFERATGEILMHAGDDLLFRSTDWDRHVLAAVEQFPDRIVFVHGDDGHWGAAFGTHGFLHRRWVDTVGYFVPPYFSSDYNDTWLNDVANMLGRRVYLSQVVTEHLHPAFGKADWDQTHLERLERHRRDDVDSLYRRLAPERDRDAALLRKVMS